MNFLMYSSFWDKWVNKYQFNKNRNTHALQSCDFGQVFLKKEHNIINLIFQQNSEINGIH